LAALDGTGLADYLPVLGRTEAESLTISGVEINNIYFHLIFFFSQITNS
jgi:hypothetical protein